VRLSGRTKRKELTMMMMKCSGPMMIAMGVVWFLIAIALLLGVAALIRFVPARAEVGPRRRRGKKGGCEEEQG